MLRSIHTEPAEPPSYMTFRDIGEQSESICYRDVTSPINELDGQSNSSRGEKRAIGLRVCWEDTHHEKYCAWHDWHVC